MTRLLRITLIFASVLAFTAIETSAAGNARRGAILDGADRVVDQQRTDADWAGTWYWYEGHTGDVTNLTGVTALGLLEAYNDTHNDAYLAAAIDAAGFIQAHLGAGATGTTYHVRTTAPDVVFLHRLAQVTGDTSYSTRATLEWDNLTSFWPTASDLDSLFHAINRRSAWDIAFFLEAAHLSGDTAWADEAANILADPSDSFYYDTGNTWYALNLGGAVRALVDTGYAPQYESETLELLNDLAAIVDDNGGVGGAVQESAYASLAFSAVGGSARKYANDLGRWLATQQDSNGGWIVSDANEYAEFNGEAVRALAATIGTDSTLDGFSPGTNGDLQSSWQRSLEASMVVPFSGQ